MTFDEYYNRWKKGQNGLVTSSNTNKNSILQNQSTSGRSSFDEFYDRWKKNREKPNTVETNKKFTNTANTNNKTITSNTSNNQTANSNTNTNNNISNQNKKSEEELIKEEQQKKAEKSANAHNTAYNSLSDQEKKYYDSYMQKISGGANSTVGPKKSSIPVSEAEKKAFQKYQTIYQKNNNETVLMSKEQYQKYQDEHPELVKKQAEKAQKEAEDYKKNTPFIERAGNALGDWQKTLTNNAGKAVSDAGKGTINLVSWGIKKSPGIIGANPKVQKWIEENQEKLTDPFESFNDRMDSQDSLASYDAKKQGEVSSFVNDKIMPTLGQLLPSFLMGTAGGKVASGVTQFAVSEGSYQDDAKARGMNEDETMVYSTIMAGFEGLSEGLTWGNAQKVGALTKEKVLLKSGKTAKNIVGEQAKKQAIKEANSSIIKRFGLNAFENAFQEGITEPVQELTAKGVSLGLTGKDKSNWENMLQRSGESAAVGGIIAVLLGGSSAGVSSATDVTSKMVDNTQNGKAINDGISDNQIIKAYNDSAKVVDADKIMNDSITRQSQKYNIALNEINNKLNQGYNTDIVQNDNVMEKNISNDDLAFQFEESDNEKINNFRADMNKYMNNSEQAHKFANTVESIINNTNTGVRLNNQLESNINGKIYTDNNGSTTIEINPNSSRSGEFIVMHELTHGIGTEELKTLINDYANTNADFNSALTELKKTYKTDDVSDEVMCDISANLLGNEDFIQKIATEKPSTFRKIYNSIKSFVKKITGKYSQEDFIRDLEVKWENAYQKNKDSISNNIGNNSFYSIQENENRKYIKVDTNQNIFEGVQEKDYNKVAKKYIQEYLLGDTKLSQNENVNINNKSAKKYTNPGYKQANFSEKMKLTPELKNVLEIAQYVDETPANKDNAKFSHYKYYTFDFELGGKMFTGNINIGVDNNGNNVFYEINKIHKRSNQLGTSLDSGVASNNSIPQSVDKVKENIKKQESETNSDSFNLLSKDNKGRTLTQNQQKYFQDSKVRDEDGNIKRVYHGTNKSGFTEFNRNINFYTDNIDVAKSYTGNNGLYEGYVNITNPITIEANKEIWSKIDIDNIKIDGIDDVQEFLNNYGASTWKEDGAIRTSTADLTSAIYDAIDDGAIDADGIIIKNIYDEGMYGDGETGKHLGTDYITFNSNQFKNLDNTSPTSNPDIRYSRNSNTWYDWLDSHFKPSKNVTNFKDIKQKIQEKVAEAKKSEKKIAPINDNMRTSIKTKMKENFDIDLSPDDISNISNKILANPTEEGVLKALDNYRDIEIEDDSGIDMDVVRDLKNTIRNTKLNVSSVKNSITDYNDMRKRNFGKLKLGNDGLQIDSFYQELSESHPEYFNKDITNVEDELNYLSDFVNTDFSNTIEYSLTDDDIKGTGIIDDLLKYTKNESRNDEIINDYTVINENAATPKETLEGLDIEKIVPDRQDVIKKNRQLAEGMIGNIKNWKDKSSGFKYQTETMERNMYDIIKDKDEAKKMIDTYFTPIHKNEAEKNRFINSYNDKIKELKLTNKEAEAVQFLGEKKYNPEFDPQKKDADRIQSYIDKKQIDMNKVDNAIEFFRKTYDQLYDRVNEVLKNNGYKEIPYRKGYFPHFQEYKANTVGGKLLTQLGINIDARSLPTDIAGITENFVPGRTWNSSSLQRKGNRTEYNVLKGFDTYIKQAGDNIFHTDDIQRLRGLENEIRYEYSDKSLRDKIDEIESNEMLDSDEKQTMIDTVVDEHHERIANPMPNFVIQLREYTNLLANKKSQFDRNSESFFARKMYSTVDAIEKRFGANSVGLNISSALTNFIPITQASSEINTINMAKALTSTIKSEIRDDGFVNKSTFLTNRLRQSENLYKTSLEKISDKANILFDGIDSFTSNVIVRGKYYQNLSKGMSELDAINDADSFAANVMADRSKGATPTFFQHRNPIAKVFSQFQLEVNNQYRFMLKDLPRDMKKEGLLKLGMAFFKMFVGAYLYNQFSENLTGRKSAFSPIDIVKDAITTATNPDLKTYDKVSSISKDVAGELPFIGGLFGGGRLPVSSALPDVGTLAKAGIGLSTGEMDSNTALKKIGNELKKPVAYLLPPMGGGQIKKTIEGLSMYSDDKPVAGSYTDSGDLRFTADNSTWGKIKAGIFGQYSSKSANDYIDSGFKSIKAKHIDELKGLEMNSTEYREYQSNLKEAKKIKDDNGYQKYFDDKGNAYWYDEKSKIVYSLDYTKTSKSIKNLEKATQNLSAYEYINNLDVTKSKKNIMLNNAIKNKKSNNTDYSKFESYAEFDYSYKNPDKYKVVKNMYDFKEYSKYSKEIKDVKKKYKYSKTDERKSAIFNYIDGLDLDVGQKLFLYKDAGYSIKDYKKEMFDYIDNLNVSKNEKTKIWNYIYGGDL